MAQCGVLYGWRYIWWQVARGAALLMTVLAGAMPGWSFEEKTGTRIGLYHTCMRAICSTTFEAVDAFDVNAGLVVANGILAVIGPAIITINLLLLTLEVGAKGRINGVKYKTFVVLRNRAPSFNTWRDVFAMLEAPVVLANLLVYVIIHMVYYQGGEFIFYVCFWVYLVAFIVLFVVAVHISVIKFIHRRRVTPPENIWNPGLLENPDLYAKGSWINADDCVDCYPRARTPRGTPVGSPRPQDHIEPEKEQQASTEQGVNKQLAERDSV